MKARILYAMSLVAVGALWAGGCNIRQPKPSCVLSHSRYGVSFRLKDPALAGTGDCADMNFERIAVDRFAKPVLGPSTVESLPFPYAQGAGPAPVPYDTPYLALMPASLAGIEDASPGFRNPAAVAFGKMEQDEPDDENLCVASTFNTVANETNDVRYEFSDVKFYVTAEVAGTQFGGDLHYTAGGCAADYSIVGLFPAVRCGSGDCSERQGEDPPCIPFSYGAPTVKNCERTGAAINPSIPVRCDAASLFCVLEGDFPKTCPSGRVPADTLADDATVWPCKS